MTWLGGIVVAALGIVLTNALVDRFDDALQPVLEGGDPVVVEDVSTYRSDQLGNSVVFPRGTSFTDEKIAELNAQDDTVAWLEGRGGVAPSTVFIRMVLAGNRETPVRLLDVEVVPRCTEPLDGVLFEDPPAGADHLPG